MTDNVPGTASPTDREVSFNPNLAAGIFFVVVGGLAAIYALASYRMGSLGSMGPGFMPTLVGAALALSGAWLIWSELARPKSGTAPAETSSVNIDELRAIVTTIGSVLVFAVLLPVLGLVGALSTLIIVSRLAKPFSIKQVLLQIVVLNVIAYGLFAVALRIPFKLLPF